MAQGYIKLDRSLLTKPLFENEKLLKVWLWCLLKASHKEHFQMVGQQKVPLQPGQFIFGRFTAADELRMPPTTVRDYMLWLQKNESITIKSANKFSLVTVVNWGLYQSSPEIPATKFANSSPPNRQQTATNKNGEKGEKDNSPYSVAFERFWSIYPRKTEKAKAFRCWQTRLKEGVPEGELITAAERYALECQVLVREERFIKHAATFLGPTRPFEDFIATDWHPPAPPAAPFRAQRPANQGKKRGLPVL